MRVRPLASLWRCLLPDVLVLAIIVVAAFDGRWRGFLPYVVAVTLVYHIRNRWIWRMAYRVCRFRTLVSGSVVLHYDPAVRELIELPTIAAQCGTDFDALAAWFGRRPGARAAVFLFASATEGSRVFRSDFAGMALPYVNSIVVSDDGQIRELIRHELAHLFAARWNLGAPPLLAEGLAVWMQGSERGEAIDAVAWQSVVEPAVLQFLLNRRNFLAGPHRYACYVLAGSFTGFLLRRFGKAPYRRLYRNAGRWGFKRTFRRSVGIDLETAMQLWRNEVLISHSFDRSVSIEQSPWARTTSAAGK